MASDTPTKIIRIDNFEQTLHSIVSDIVYKVKKQQATATHPLEVEKEWVMSRLREQINEGGYTIEPACNDPLITLGPFFNKIPQELRDMIFADCLASGYPQFMATSRALREGGMGQIWEKGVFRVNSGVVHSTKVCPRPTQKITNKIQNLNIRLKGCERYIPYPCWIQDLDILKIFGGSKVPRKSCKILYEHKTTPSCLKDQLRAVINSFVGFKEMELRLPESLDFPRELSDRQKMRLGEEYCELGPWSMEVDGEGLSMRFHPVHAQLSIETTSPG